MHHTTLPVHPVTGALALGWRKARPGETRGELFPIWPVLGAAEGDQDEGDDDGDQGEGDGQGGDAGDQGDDGDEGQEPEGADQLGDAGKKALDSMKSRWKSEREKRRELEQRLTERDKPADGDQPDVDAVRAEAAREATEKANARILRSEVRAAAAGKLADPKDALRFLDLDTFEVGEDGEIDSEEIAEAIEELISNKPYLAAAKAPRFQGTGDGGAARKAGKPKQLTRDDVKRMSPAQIVKAKDEGRLDEALGINR